MPDFSADSEVFVFGPAAAATSTVFRLTGVDGASSLLITGTGFTYSGGIPTGGTITSVAHVITAANDAPIFTITNINVNMAALGTLLSDIFTTRAAITWLGQIGTDAEAILFSATQIRLQNANGTFTDFIGTGLPVSGGSGLTGNVTAIRHIAADGSTILTQVNINQTLGIAASAIFEDLASDQIYQLLHTGANTVTGGAQITFNGTTYFGPMYDGAGNDTLIGTALGTSYVEFENNTVGGTINLATGTATFGSDTNTLTNILGAGGTEFSDTMVGSGVNNSLSGWGGDDNIDGGGGNDAIMGGDGNDTLNGGSGFDVVFYENDDVVTGVTVSLNIAGPQDTIGAGIDTLSNFEAVIGTVFADNLTGNAGLNFLQGLGGNDTLNGLGGTDYATYALNSSGASWVRNPNGSWTVTATGLGVDTLTNIEFLDFVNRDVFLARAPTNFNGDGVSDLLWRNNNTGAISLWLISGTQQISNGGGFGGAAGWSPAGSGNFNGDDIEDIIWQTNGVISLWLMNSNQQPSNGGSWAIPVGWGVDEIGDFNGDGISDVLLRNSTTGQLSIWRFSANQQISDGGSWFVGNEWDIAQTGDFNSDGIADLLWRSTSGVATLWLYNAAGTPSNAGGWYVPPSWTAQETGDFNRDGISDILWRNSSGELSLWLMGTNQQPTNGGGWYVPPSWNIADVGDYNGDGVSDIMWRGPSGELSLWLFDQNQQISNGGSWYVPPEWGTI